MLEPSSGNILINSKQIAPLQEYPLDAGYVSQSVYLTDDSILFNIALSKKIPKIKIDDPKKVVKFFFRVKIISNFNFQNERNCT